MELLERTGTIRDGDRATLRVGVGPFGFRFTVEHEGYQPLKEFGDRHIGGPYRSLRHRHVFRSTGEASCELTDRIHCEPRLMSAMLGRAWLQRTMERTAGVLPEARPPRFWTVMLPARRSRCGCWSPARPG